MRDRYARTRIAPVFKVHFHIDDDATMCWCAGCRADAAPGHDIAAFGCAACRPCLVSNRLFWPPPEEPRVTRPV